MLFPLKYKYLQWNPTVCDSSARYSPELIMLLMTGLVAGGLALAKDSQAQDPELNQSQGLGQPANEAPANAQLPSLSEFQALQRDLQLSVENRTDTGVKDERGFPIRGETYDDTPGIGGFTLDSILNALAKENRVQAFAYELDVTAPATDTININNAAYRPTGEQRELPVVYDERGSLIETSQLPHDSNWMLVLRIMSDLQSRETVPVSRFLNKIGSLPAGGSGGKDTPTGSSESDPTNIPGPPITIPD